MSKKTAASEQKKVDDWNAKYPVGTKFIVTLDSGREVETISNHEATLLGGHTAVGWFDGIRGCYALSSARQVEDDIESDYEFERQEDADFGTAMGIDW